MVRENGAGQQHLKRVNYSEMYSISFTVRLCLSEYRDWGQIKKIINEPELTKMRLVDGWMLSANIGKIDENGYVYLTDRKDYLIILGGFNIWPTELENIISNLPGVREVATVAAPHDRWGKTPVAVLVLEQNCQLMAQDVIEACRKALGSYKKSSKVNLQYDPLPRTPVGKIQRKAVREKFWIQNP